MTNDVAGLGVSWRDFEAATPGLARDGRALLRRGDGEEGLLATVRGDGLPRINPVSIKIVGGRLLVFVLPSAKRADLAEDGRYALHAHRIPPRRASSPSVALPA